MQHSPLFEVVGAEDKAKEQGKEVVVEVADVVGSEDKAEEQGKEVIVEEADVERVVVEKESASDAFAEHGDVQSDDVVCLDIDIQAQEGGSAKYYINNRIF